MTLEQTLNKCEQYLDTKLAQNGIGKTQIANPLISVFIGHESINFEEEVIGIYNKCWLGDSDHQIAYSSIDYNPEEEHEILLTAMEHNYPLGNESYIAYYWDIMDDSFDEFFEKIKTSLLNNRGILPKRSLIYAFFKQGRPSESSISKTRIQSLIDFIQNGQVNSSHLFLFSDVLQSGYLGNKRIIENYRLAADITVLIDSYDISRKKMATDLSFNIGQIKVLTTGYYCDGKDYNSIIRTSLYSLLNEYENVSKNSTAISVKEAVSTKYGSFIELFNQIFDEEILPLLPQDAQYLRYIYRTSEIEKYHYYTEPKEKKNKISFSTLFQKKSLPSSPQSNSIDNIKQSLGAFWKEIMNMYYIGPAFNWFKNATCDDTGRNKAEDILQKKITTVLTYKQFQNREILLEAEEYTSKTVEAVYKELNVRTKHSIIESALHESAIQEIKAKIYTEFFHIIGKILTNLCANGNSFENRLVNIKNSLNSANIEKTISEAYPKLVADYAAKNAERIKETICPCEREDDILSQLSILFKDVVENTNEYHYSYPQELNWRMSVVKSVSVNTVLENCFSMDILKTVRIRTIESVSGWTFTMLSNLDTIISKIDNSSLDYGDIYEISLSDFIERVSVFPINIDQIFW